MPNLSWYWHRLRAMSPVEVALHVCKKWRAAVDAKRTSWPEVNLDSSAAFPKLPKPEDAPEVLRDALRRDAENILAGRWKFFGHLEFQVDDPPKWQYDYLVRQDVETTASGFKLDYRTLGDGVDSKVIWEPSRWHQLVRLAMAAYVLGDRRAGEKCVDWLEDWVRHNPPYRGWNWTSALEVGMRLVQFTWIDALLSGFANREVGPPSPRPSPPGEGARTAASEISTVPGANQAPPNAAKGFDGGSGVVAPPLPGGEGRGEGERKHQITGRLERLRREILPPHIWYAWRHRSFGSSANNHLIGELAGLILATVRWPGLTQIGTSLEELQRRWEHEVLAQFAEDGGNKEQALNYHLFSWEFCWQARMALTGARRKVSLEVDERLRRAAQFFVDVQVPSDPWDYGDSDSVFVAPLFADGAVAEWCQWITEPGECEPIEYWLGADRQTFGTLRPDGSEWRLVHTPTPQYWDCEQPTASGRERTLRIKGKWLAHEDSGQLITVEDDWRLRFDCSWLGFLKTAAHGHLDALHLSIWLRGVAVVIDPGTGAYYADKTLRCWLASRSAHNSPCLVGVREWPERMGAFLWARQHYPPRGFEAEDGSCGGNLFLHDENPEGGAVFYRTIEHALNRTWVVSDREGSGKAFSVRWQFAPESQVQAVDSRRIWVSRRGVSMEVQVSADWAEVFCVTDESQVAKADPDAPLAGTVSPAFRKTVWAPYLKLVARPQGDKPCVFTTTFLASADS